MISSNGLIIKHRWNPKGHYEVQPSSKGFFTIIFFNLEDKDPIFKNGPYVGYVLYSLHVCVWARQIRQLRLMIPLIVPFVSCAPGAFLGGSQGGAGMLFLADFAIFNGFLN
jgi:hypothetical protein